MLQRGTPKMRPKLGKDHQPIKDRHGNPVYETVKDKNGKVVYEPYRIKVLNTINFKKSMHYNPFAYIHSEKDILKLVTTLIANTKGEGKAGDDFWVKAETLLYCALIGYIHYEAPVEEQNFSTLIEFINAMEVREDDEEFKNPVDLMFDALEAEKPNHFAVRQYKKYKLAAGKTAKSILISCGARLAVFDIAELREVTSYDELELDTLGDRKTALFLIMSDTDDSFNFLISMCYTQLFNLLCEKADDVYGGRLPVHVRCLIDECANIGQIPKLEKLVATIRSREISACLVLQAQSQLKAIYKDNADTIIGNMDTSIFLGGKEPTTLKELAAVLGKETIDTYNTGEDSAFGVCHHIGAVHLHQVGFQPEAGLTGTGAADDQHIFVSGGLGVFGAAVHGQALGFRQNHIVLENRVHIRGDVLVCSPAGGTILHAVAVFLRIFAFQIYRQPQTTTAADSHQQVQRV